MQKQVHNIHDVSSLKVLDGCDTSGAITPKISLEVVSIYRPII